MHVCPPPISQFQLWTTKISHSSGAWRSEIRFPVWSGSALFWVSVFSSSSHMVERVRKLFYKGTNPIQVGSTLMSWSPPKRSISWLHHTGGKGLNRILEKHVLTTVVGTPSHIFSPPSFPLAPLGFPGPSKVWAPKLLPPFDFLGNLGWDMSSKEMSTLVIPFSSPDPRLSYPSLVSLECGLDLVICLNK